MEKSGVKRFATERKKEVSRKGKGELPEPSFFLTAERIHRQWGGSKTGQLHFIHLPNHGRAKAQGRRKKKKKAKKGEESETTRSFIRLLTGSYRRGKGTRGEEKSKEAHYDEGNEFQRLQQRRGRRYLKRKD